jgi:hypothetical protein
MFFLVLLPQKTFLRMWQTTIQDALTERLLVFLILNLGLNLRQPCLRNRKKPMIRIIFFISEDHLLVFIEENLTIPNGRISKSKDYYDYNLWCPENVVILQKPILLSWSLRKFVVNFSFFIIFFLFSFFNFFIWLFESWQFFFWLDDQSCQILI